MITLNGERGFEQVSSWEEIQALAGFTSNLDPDKKELQEIIARYAFQEKIPCGLSTCHQPHARGYIVTTKSGEVTNIGNICGRNHFGVEFDTYSKAFTRALTDYNNREIIASFLFNIEAYRKNVRDIRKEHHGADWVYTTSRDLVGRNHGCPEQLVFEIKKMIRARSGEIRVEREATEEEIGQQEAMTGQSLPRPQYIEESRGMLRGIECLYPENDLREILVMDIGENLREIGEFNLRQSTSVQLKRWAKWVQGIDDKLKFAQEAVRAGRLLLTHENLAQLCVFFDNPRSEEMYNRWLAAKIGRVANPISQ